MNALLAQLSEPFDPKYLTWKPGATTKDGNKCMAMAYADLRAYMERLDNVCGLDWSCRYVPWIGNKIICELTINGVTRSSTGDADPQDEKNELDAYVAEAQAFKRAAVMFGLGRSLYSLPSAWVEYDPQRKKITDNGKRELQQRYEDWYKKTMAAKPMRVVDTTTGEITDPANDVEFKKQQTPNDDELDILSEWDTPQDAYNWAIALGSCLNEYEAKNSMKKAAQDYGGKITETNKHAVYLAFLRRQYEKIAERPAMQAVAA